MDEYNEYIEKLKNRYLNDAIFKDMVEVIKYLKIVDELADYLNRVPIMNEYYITTDDIRDALNLINALK